jgi:Lon protease-like protein
MKVEIPSRAPIMPLPNATLFPHSLLPLYIYEPRYREMLRDCLQSQRMFCIALMKPGVEEAKSEDDFYHVTGVGLVRACVGNEDQTSNLILQGVARVRCDEINNTGSYCKARLSLLKTQNQYEVSEKTLRDQLSQLTRDIEGSGGSMPQQLAMCFKRKCAVDMLIDLVAFNFLSDPYMRQQILEEVDVTSRLSLLRRFVNRQLEDSNNKPGGNS